jgi:hypothetical protein
VALGALAYLYYERTKLVVKIDVPGVSGEITKEGVDIEVGKPKKLPPRLHVIHGAARCTRCHWRDGYLALHQWHGFECRPGRWRKSR